jgi:hypothetical protein
MRRKNRQLSACTISCRAHSSTLLPSIPLHFTPESFVTGNRKVHSLTGGARLPQSTWGSKGERKKRPIWKEERENKSTTMMTAGLAGPRDLGMEIFRRIRSDAADTVARVHRPAKNSLLHLHLGFQVDRSTHLLSPGLKGVYGKGSVKFPSVRKVNCKVNCKVVLVRIAFWHDLATGRTAHNLGKATVNVLSHLTHIKVHRGQSSGETKELIKAVHRNGTKGRRGDSRFLGNRRSRVLVIKGHIFGDDLILPEG